MARTFICLYIFLCLRSVFSQILFGESCKTLLNVTGTCITIYSCQPYIALLSNPDPEVYEFLRRSFCGFDGSKPKVCCPLQYGPTSTPSAAKATTTTTTTTTTSTTTTTTTEILETDLKYLYSNESEDYIADFPLPPECGNSPASFDKVVGGVDAKLGDLPWMVLLGYIKNRYSSTTSWNCGGTLISHHHVLTAAHCIHGFEKELYLVRLGELNLAREDEGATPVDVLIKHKIKHENYNSVSYVNDIGLLILERDIPYSDLIKPICIPTTREMRSLDFVDYRPFIAGWGKTHDREAQATHLQVLQLPVLSNDFCIQAYSLYKEVTVDNRVLCAGYSKGGKDSCQGDSGGPLMQPMPLNFTSYYYQIGVISFGLKQCARPGYAGIYTRVTSFLPWLQQHVLGSVQVYV